MGKRDFNESVTNESQSHQHANDTRKKVNKAKNK